MANRSCGCASRGQARSCLAPVLLFRACANRTHLQTHQGGRCMAMQTIEELFEHELKDIYGAEHALLDALEQMAGESSDREIKKAYTQHRKETQGQIKR